MTAPLPVPASTILPTDAENGVCTGQLDGEFSVTSDGAAVYRLPLWVPPGRNGMQPELALQYDSRSGYGVLGVGWSLTGIPSITRCQRRFADNDGPVAPVRFDDTDHFCLGGQRLVAVDGVNGADGTEYRTRRESFSRITIKGTDRLGPLVFEMRMRDGRILTFGADTPLNQRVQLVPDGPGISDIRVTRSNVRFSWSLRRVEDRSGNMLEIDYGVVVDPPDSALRGEFLPTQVRYTGSSNPSCELPPTKSVRFFYGSHPEPIIGYVSGLEIRRAARLERIEMWGPNAGATELLRLYEVTYDISPVSHRSLVSTIRECDGWPTTPAIEGGALTPPPRGVRTGACKLPIVFDWERGSSEFSEPADWGSDTFGDVSSRVLSGRLLPVDLNGDGRDDLVCVIPTGALSGVDDGRDHYGFLISDGVGLGPLQVTAWRTLRALGLPRPIDFDMDGHVELLMYDEGKPPSRANARTVLNRVTVDATTHLVAFEEVATFPAGQYEVVDFDGNQLANIVLPWGDGSFWRNMWGDYFDGPQPLPVPPIGDPRVVGQHLILDIDGDGALEVLCPQFKSPPKTLLTPLPFIPTNPLRYAAVAPGKPIVEVDLFSDQHYVFADLNGDGLVDAITFGTRPNDPPYVTTLINTGSGFMAAATQQLALVTLRTAEVRAISYACDGRQQLLVRPLTGLLDDPMYILRWDGTRLVEVPLTTRTLWTDGEKFKVIEVLDVNGNGLDDFVMLNQTRPAATPLVVGPGGTPPGPTSPNGPPTEPPSLRVYRRKGRMPDMLVGIRNALGWRRSIWYAPLSDPTVYRDRLPTAYPLYATKAKRWVVAGVTEGDGRGGSNAREYRYEDGRTDLLGEGFLGFLAQECTDTSTGTITRSTYDLIRTESGVYAYAGMPVDVLTRWTLPGGVERVRSVHTEYGIRTDPTGQAVFSFPHTVHELETELSGGNTETVLDRTTTQDFDAYGNQTVTAVSWPDGSREIRRVSYAPRPADWLIAIPDIERRQSVTALRTRIRRVAYVHDAAGRMIEQIIEPGMKVMNAYVAMAPQADGVQTLFIRYFYNAEGTTRRIEASPLSAPGAPARSIDFTYDAVERAWMTSATNTLGHTSRFSHHAGLAVPAITEDENGLRTTYQYDRFGRIRHRTSPDGNDVTLSYVTQTPLPAGVPGVPISQCTHLQFAAGPEVFTVFDVLGRSVVERFLRRADSRAVLRRSRYDQVGRLSAVSEPHFESDAPTWSTIKYDSLGRVTTRHFAVGSTEKFTYQGRTIVWTNARNRPSTLELDDRGRVIRQIETSGLNTSCVTTYIYGPFDQLELAVDAAGVPTRMTYDRLGRLLRIVDPNARQRLQNYTAFGELRTVVRTNQTVTYKYDDLGRLLQLDAPEGATVYTWDTAPKGIGKLATSMSADGVSIAYGYDGVGRPRSKLWTIKSKRFELAVGFDAVGRLAGVSYPHAGGTPLRVVYQYGAFGDLVTVANAATAAPYWTRVNSDASGEFATDLLGNGVTTAWTPSTTHPGLLRQIRDVDAAGSEIQNLLYEFDGNLNLIRRDDRVLNAREASRYDSLDRLKAWDRASSAGPIASSWIYDDVGNISSATKWAGPGGFGTLNYKYGLGTAGPHAVASTEHGPYVYDERGNQRLAPGRSVHYTSFDLPATATINGSMIAFDYDGEQNRVHSVVGAGAEVVSLAGLCEHRTLDQRQLFLIRVGGRAIAQIERRQGVADSVTYLHTDHFGSLQATSDATGSVTGFFRYDPFGRRLDPLNPAGPTPVGPTNVLVGFSGHHTSDWPGLIDMQGRWYDTTVARFLSPDPIRPLPSRGQRQNAYSYAMNNPLSWTDPSGMEPQDYDESDPFIGLVQQYLGEHRDDSWRTLDDAVDWAHREMTTAGSIPNETGWGGAGVAGLSTLGGLGRPVGSLGGILVADAGRASDARGLTTQVMGEAKSAVRDALYDLEHEYGDVPGWKWGLGAAGTSSLILAPFVSALGFGGAALSVETVAAPLAPLLTTIRGFQQWGNQWRDAIAQNLKRIVPVGHTVWREVTIRTPFGLRHLDVVVLNELGEIVGAIEAKTGGSVYLMAQRAKDAWIMASHGFPIFLYRYPWSSPWFR